MARKDRTPSPPKRPQGPQRRSTPTSPAAAQERRKLILLLGAGALVALVAVLAVVLLTGGGKDERQTLEAAGCTLQSFPALPNKSDHSDVPTLDTKPKWNSNPPTSGPHYGQTAVWGSYDEPVPLVQTVHNLEHGGVVIHYGPRVPKADVEQLKGSFYSDDPNGIVISPLPSNGNKITLSAWTAPDASTGTSDRGRGWLATCTAFDPDAFKAFVDAHRFQGPERIPPELLAPGS
jgi:hypothetical protein